MNACPLNPRHRVCFSFYPTDVRIVFQLRPRSGPRGGCCQEENRRWDLATCSAYLDVEETWRPAKGRRGSSNHFGINASFETYGYTRSAPYRLNSHIGGYLQRSHRRILPKTLLTGEQMAGTPKTLSSLEVASQQLCASCFSMRVSMGWNVHLGSTTVRTVIAGVSMTVATSGKIQRTRGNCGNTSCHLYLQ